ncbi:hypothetical protein EDB80DRAFT_722093 [Ilyonectria destructans]|nr:hypothetical protein EDB80DRAFT_722093 [Ilyonectria destructans]
MPSNLFDIFIDFGFFLQLIYICVCFRLASAEATPNSPCHQTINHRPKMHYLFGLFIRHHTNYIITTSTTMNILFTKWQFLVDYDFLCRFKTMRRICFTVFSPRTQTDAMVDVMIFTQPYLYQRPP